jgi:hypothetical protein
MNEKIRTNQKLWDADESAMLEIYDYHIKLQTERDLLFKAHSHEMVRADKLAIENESLKVALMDIIAISDRKHDAWDKAKELLK